MRNRIRRGGCLLILLIILPAAALGGTIDDLIRMLTRPADGTAALEMRAEALHVPELGELRTEWLNRLLRHVTFRMRAGEGMQEEVIAVDGRPAIGAVSRTGTDGTAWQFTFDSGTSYSAPEGEMLLAAVSGVSADVSRLDYYSEIAVLLDGFYRFFEGLPAAFPESASLSRVNTKYKPYGTAVKKWTISLPDDILQSEKMSEYLSKKGMEIVREYLSNAVLTGRQRLTLLTDENDRLMKVNYTAKAGLSEDDIRNINLDWRCLRGEEGYKDILQLTTPGQGSRRNNLMITQEMTTDPESGEHYAGSIETDQVENRVRTRIVLSFDLKSTGDTIEGELTEKTTAGNQKSSAVITISLRKNAQDEYAGSLEIISKLDKIEKDHYRFQLTAGKTDPPEWNNIPARLMTETDRERIAENAARAFLNALADVPEEDLQFFLADLPEGVWAGLNTTIDESEETVQP